MQTRWTLALWMFWAVVATLPGQVCAQDDVPPDPELGFLPPEEDLPDPPGEEADDPPSQDRSRSEHAGGETSSGGSLSPRRGAGEGRHGQQTQVLARHQVRIEAGPPDFALRDSGYLGEGRGLRLGRADLPPPNGGLYAGLGVGLSVGVLENFEVGILQLPVILANGFGGADFGNIEMHARYGALRGDKFELGVQAVVQVPTNSLFGAALGMPVRVLATESLIIDTGLEFEILKATRDAGGGAAVNLDLPIAVNYYVVPEAFVGGRVGLFVFDFREVYIPLGVQGGYALKDGMVQLLGWFQWAAVPLGEGRFSTKVLDAGSFEFGVGCNVTLDFGS